jgi:hypothetical protein
MFTWANSRLNKLQHVKHHQHSCVPHPSPACCVTQVAGWLGVADVEEVLQQEGLNPEFEMGRPQGLGLGAKYLPHRKVGSGQPAVFG